MTTATATKCFLCSQVTTEGLKLSSDEAVSFVLCNILELPRFWNNECKKLEVAQAVTYCQLCSQKITELQVMLDELEDLESRILSQKQEVEFKLKESWKFSRQNGRTDDPVDKFRAQVVAELKSCSILSMLSKIKEDHVAKKFQISRNNVQLAPELTETRTTPAPNSAAGSEGSPRNPVPAKGLSRKYRQSTHRTLGSGSVVRIAKDVSIPNINIALPLPPQPPTAGVIETAHQNSYPTVTTIPTTTYNNSLFHLTAEDQKPSLANLSCSLQSGDQEEEIMMPVQNIDGQPGFLDPTTGTEFTITMESNCSMFQNFSQEEAEFDSTGEHWGLPPPGNNLDQLAVASEMKGHQEILPTHQMSLEDQSILPHDSIQDIPSGSGGLTVSDFGLMDSGPGTSGTQIDLNLTTRRTNSGRGSRTFKSYVCGTCGLCFSNIRSLKDHDEVHASDGRPSSISTINVITGAKRRCPPRTHKASPLLAKRSPAATAGASSERLVCNECDRTFAQKTNLTNHILKQHRGVSKIQCPICGYGVMTSSHLRAHLASTHSTERNFKCSICHAAYKNQRVLNIHIRKHTGEKPYQCALCPEKFIDSTFLRRHERACHGDPFVCQLCQKSFVERKSLARHMLKHSERRKSKGTTRGRNSVQGRV